MPAKREDNVTPVMMEITQSELACLIISQQDMRKQLLQQSTRAATVAWIKKCLRSPTELQYVWERNPGSSLWTEEVEGNGQNKELRKGRFSEAAKSYVGRRPKNKTTSVLFWSGFEYFCYATYLSFSSADTDR